MIRGGHIDVAVLGAMEVSEHGDLANWIVPARRSRAWVARWTSFMAPSGDRHDGTRDQRGRAQDRADCSLPLTGKRCVHRIITDFAVIDIDDDGLVLRETAPGVSVDEVRAATGAEMRLHYEYGERPVYEQRGLWYEELEVGALYRHAPGRTVSEADNILFSTLTMNPQALHLDEAWAAQQPSVSASSTASSRCRRSWASRSRS